MDEERVGRAVRELRQLAGLSQQDLAAAVGVSQGTLSLWELGRGEMRLSDARRLADALELPLTTLLREFGLPVEGEPISLGQWIDRRREQMQQNPVPPFGRTLRRGRVTGGSAPPDSDGPARSPASVPMFPLRHGGTRVLAVAAG